VKTAIGTMMTTGAAVGVGSNVFGITTSPKYLRPFAWGATGESVARDAFLTVATRVMPRRYVQVDERVRAMLTAIYDHATAV